MQIDKELLLLLGHKSHYGRLYNTVNGKALEDEVKQLLDSLEGFYKAFPEVQQVDWGDFCTWLLTVDKPYLKDDKKIVFRELCKVLADSEPNEAMQKELIEALVERHYAADMRDIAEEVLSGKGKRDISDIKEALENYTAEMGNVGQEDEHFVDTAFEDIVEEFNHGDGYEWRLEELNQACGPLRLGDMVLLGARFEVGKTTFLASEITYMAQQIRDDRPVIWFNNEEEGRKVKFRILQAALQAHRNDITKHLPQAAAKYTQIMHMEDRIKVYDNKNMDIHEIEAVCKRHTPAIIVFDQLRKVRGYDKKSGNEVMRLQRLYQFARGLAGEYGPVVTVHQADATAEGMMKLTPNQLEGCKTELQGEIDLQLMMGCGDRADNARCLTIGKNKLFGGPRTQDYLKHGSFDITIDPERATFIGNYHRE